MPACRRPSGCRRSRARRRHFSRRHSRPPPRPTPPPAPPPPRPPPRARRVGTAAGDLGRIVKRIDAAGWPALGTTVSVRVTRAGELGAARRGVEVGLTALDLACSRFRDDSELTRVNGHDGRWQSVGPLLAEAIATALRAAALTDGAVDPTIGDALVLAGYDRDFAAGLAEPSGRVTARRVPGWRVARLDERRGRVRVPAGTKLDL